MGKDIGKMIGIRIIKTSTKIGGIWWEMDNPDGTRKQLCKTFMITKRKSFQELLLRFFFNVTDQKMPSTRTEVQLLLLQKMTYK